MQIPDTRASHPSRPSIPVLLALALMGLPADGAAPPAEPPGTSDSPWVARADLNYDQPPARSEAGLPIGNGTMGSLLWTHPGALKLQINRVDVFANGSNTRSFPIRHTDYCGACGFVDLDFSKSPQEVFPRNGTKEHLSCLDGLARIDGAGVKIEALAWTAGNVIAIQVTDERQTPGPVAIALRMLRPAKVQTRNHLATSTLETRSRRIALAQKFEEDDYFCSSAVAVDVLGRDTQVRPDGEGALELSAAAGKGTFLVLISSAASFDRQTDVVADALQRLDPPATMGFAGLIRENADWWRQFWSRSSVRLHSADGVADRIEQNYTYYLYIMGATSRGRYPAKFNGMLWATGGDRRNWGGQFWGNEGCFYNNALFAANHAELMEPMWSLYSGMADACAVAARQQWGSQGIYIPETTGFDGPPRLPDAIAAEMRELYLLRKSWSERSGAFLDYARPMIAYSSRWNWKGYGSGGGSDQPLRERGSGPYGNTSHIFSSGAKIAYAYWLGYEFGGDENWLRDRAYPILKGVAEFYRNYPNLRQEADGRYHLYFVNSGERVWGARDTDEEITAMRGLLPVVIKASEILQTDQDLRARWRDLLNHLAPLAVGADGGWIKGLAPVVHGEADSPPDENSMPMWNFDLCSLEAGADLARTATTTYEDVLKGLPRNRWTGGLSKIPLVAAMLGRTDDVETFIPAQIDGQSSLANRMDSNEGDQTTNVERLGNAANALHTALCQDLPAGPGQAPVIRVFPAWPKHWDAAFTLLCRGGFLVSSEMRGGRVESVAIHAQRGGEVRLRNPWPEARVDLYRNEAKTETLEGALLKIATQNGERIVVRRSGDSPQPRL